MFPVLCGACTEFQSWHSLNSLYFFFFITNSNFSSIACVAVIQNVPQWNNWHMTFSPDIVRSFLSMWSDSELCSVMLNAVDRSTRQHPKPLAWDFVFPRTKALYSLRLWSPVSGELWLLHSFMSYMEHKPMLPHSQRVLQNIDVHQSSYPDIAVLILIRACAKNVTVSQPLVDKEKTFLMFLLIFCH